MPINGIIGGTRLPDGTPSGLSGVHTIQQHQEWVSRGRYDATAILATALLVFPIIFSPIIALVSTFAIELKEI